MKFLPLQTKDIPLLTHWFKQPHVFHFWPHRISDLQIHTQYENQILSDWIFPYLILKKNQPIGFIQSRMAWKEKNRLWPDEQEGVFRIKLLIGEEKNLNQGLGTQALTQFIEMLFANPCLPIKHIIVQVTSNNPRALTCYQKVGFLPIREIITAESKTIMMQIERN